MKNNDDAALVLIDVQKSFFDQAGGNYFPGTAAIEPHLHRLLHAAREGGRVIIHVAERHRPNIEDFESVKLPRHCIDGEYDAEFAEGFGPRGGNEHLLPKRRVSAFFATDLDMLLREKNICRLVIAGVKTNVCVRATVIDGFSLGYRCHVVKDAVASNRQNLADASLEDIERYFGFVITTKDAEGMLL